MFVRTKLPPLKTGIEFLAASHFVIGKEPELLANGANAYRSTVKCDYPQQHVERVGLCKLPPPAQIFSGDSKHVDSCSVTRGEFVPLPYARTNYAGSAYAKTETNFKPDRDLRIETFRTTNADVHVPFPNQTSADRSTFDALEWKRSHIPQGDKAKERWPESDYKQKFREHPLEAASEHVGNPTFNAASTIRGDARSHGGDLYSTSSRRAFQQDGSQQRRNEVAYHTKYPSTNIPTGDREKNLDMLSTMQTSFERHVRGSVDEYGRARKVVEKTFDRKEALQKLQQTTFRDGDERLNCFRSTAGESYANHNGAVSGELPAGKHEVMNSNAQNVPEGDMHTLRASERVNTTSNRNDFNTPPDSYRRTAIVDGSQIRTRSNVTFGKSGGEQYSTTTGSEFPHKTSTYKKAETQTCTSNIPVDYYQGIVPSSSYRSNFQQRPASKMKLNPAAIDNLKKSHIQEPMLQRDFRQFETTNEFDYTPKPECREKNLDVGRLQRSNVPLGTMQRPGDITIS